MNTLCVGENKDIPLALGTVLVYTVLLVLLNLVVDILCAMANPRIRLPYMPGFFRAHAVLLHLDFKK